MSPDAFEAAYNQLADLVIEAYEADRHADNAPKADRDSAREVADERRDTAMQFLAQIITAGACEHSMHMVSQQHSGPARFIIESTCLECPRKSKFAICEEGWASARLLYCRLCLARDMPRDAVWRIIAVINGGAS